MCLAPVTLPNGVTIACRQCWQCINEATDDVVGRCLAEMSTATGCSVVTLTYGKDEVGRDHDSASYLRLRDLQNYLKRWRNDGYPLRYLAVGEYGTHRARAHWHVIIFWQGEVPEIRDKKWTGAVYRNIDGSLRNMRMNLEEKHWEYGFSFFDEPNYDALKYAVKYMHKTKEDGSKASKIAYSLFPPLGSEYFKRRAFNMASQGLVPKDSQYTFPGIYKNRSRKTLRRFRLKGTSLDRFLTYYTQLWVKIQGERHTPPCPFYEEWLDTKVAKMELLCKAPPKRFPKLHPPPWGFKVGYAEVPGLFYAVSSVGTRVWFTNKHPHNEGVWSWMENPALDEVAGSVDQVATNETPSKRREISLEPVMGESYTQRRLREINSGRIGSKLEDPSATSSVKYRRSGGR